MSAAVFPKISIVVPVYNERENLAPLFEKIKNVLSRTGFSYECLFIDDGSQDDFALRVSNPADRAAV